MEFEHASKCAFAKVCPERLFRLAQTKRQSQIIQQSKHLFHPVMVASRSSANAVCNGTANAIHKVAFLQSVGSLSVIFRMSL